MSDLFLEYKKRPGRDLLARLLERHQAAVYSVCYRVLRHQQDAEDACQEVLIEVSRQVDAIAEPAAFSGWLYRTALHTALDVRRKRGRQRIRDAGARPADAGAPPSPDAEESLQQGLSGLDETTRMLVVEHYFARRPLRELAEERGCSEVAVWKRIQGARERLKQVLGSAVLPALDVVWKFQVPAGLVRKALGLTGAAAMSTKAGLPIAVALPLLLLAGAGGIVYVRQARPPEPPAEVRKPSTLAAGTLAAPAGPAAAPRVIAAAEPVAKPAPPRRPYPFKVGASGHSDAAMHAWGILSSKRVTLDIQNAPLPALLRELGLKTGLTILCEPGLEQDLISFKVADFVADGCLRLMLGPRLFAYEIRPDGTVFVGAEDKIEGGYEKVGRELQSVQMELRQVGEELSQGWDGLRDTSDTDGELESLLRTKRLTIPQGETTLEREFQRIRAELGVPVQLDVPSRDPVAMKDIQDLMKKPFLQVVGERTAGEHLERLAREQKLVALPSGGMLLLTTEEQAAQHRWTAEQQRQEYRESLEKLRKPVEGPPSLSVPDFLDAIPRTHGLPVLPSEEVWNCPATLSLPAGATLREGLDQLKALGFRWALRDGKLYLLK